MDDERIHRKAMELVGVVIEETARPEDWERMRALLGAEPMMLILERSEDRVVINLGMAPIVTVDLRNLIGREA